MEKSYNSYMWQSSTGYRDNHKSKKMVKSRFLDQFVLYTLMYHTLFIVTMCGEPLVKHTLNPLLFCRKTIIRIIAVVKPRTSTGSLFDQFKCLKCIKINKYLIGRLMFKIHNDESHIFKAFFIKKILKFMNMKPDKNIIIISHRLIPTSGKTVWDTQVPFSGMKF